MKTSRTDVERNKRQSKCFGSTLIGHSTYILKCGDLFLYKERYTDGTEGTRLAKCHGRVRPDHNDAVSDGREWRILAQAASDDMTFTYERWVDPKDVIQITPKNHANKNVIAFFEETED